MNLILKVTQLTAIIFTITFLSGPVSAAPTKDTTYVNTESGAIVHSTVEEVKPKPVTLPSGKKIKVISVSTINFARGGDPPGYLLRYETDLPIDDVEQLHQEAVEIWKDFRKDVENVFLSIGIITACDDGKKRSCYTHSWRTDANGKWQEVLKK